MAVSTIALYASSPSSVCSASHQIASYDFLDVNGRSTATTSSSSSSSSAKPAIGGLSCLFSSSPSTIKSSNFSDEFTTIRSDEYSLGSSFRYSSSLKRDNLVHQSSPLSVLQGFGGSSIGSGCSRISGDFSSARSGFVTHALGVGTMCVGYDNDSSACVGVARGFEDELTFDMEGSGLSDVDLPPDAKDVLVEAQSRHDVFRDEMVVKAFYTAEKAHRGQNRASGHPYLQHCLETATLLADIGANSMVVAAGLLHDTLDDCSISYGDIRGLFGAGVADLVEGVSKLSHLSKLARENNTASKTDEADRLHTMFLAMADARAVLIKLADRLHNMSTLDALPLIKQQRIAKETLEIFVPLANRLGIFTWKEKLENLCFKYLYPAHHHELSKLLNSYDDALITSSIEKLKLALKNAGVDYSCVSGRHKSPYSIYSKMIKKKLNMDEIHDIHGLRLIVEKEEDCYKALAVVQQLWDEVPGRFKDYIIHPKFNGYRSLHTVVTGEGMAPLEVQIRTKEMHLQAEYGFAAHWRYKEGECKHSSFVLQMVEWARWVISWQCEAMNKDKESVGLVDSLKPQCTFPTHSKDCTFSCKPNCDADEPVFVIMIDNDKMSVQEFPVNSTVMDLLETSGRGSWRRVSYGFPSKEELRPRLNHEPVSDPMCKLKMGDVVELTPAIPDESLTVYREEIQRMYDRGLTTSKGGSLSANNVATGFRS